MSDLVSRLLAAIEETERTVELAGPAVIGWAAYCHDNGNIRYCSPVAQNGDAWVTAGAETEPSSVTIVFDPAAVLRRCAADREEVELHAIVWRDIGWLEWDEGEHAEMYEELPVCGLCVPKHSSFPTRADVPEGPCQTIRLRARAYGISVEEGTPG